MLKDREYKAMEETLLYMLEEEIRVRILNQASVATQGKRA